MDFMRYREMTPIALCEELGSRLKQARLNENIPQAVLTKRSGLTRKAVINAERGACTMEVFVCLLQTLDLTSKMDLFLPKQLISPIALAKLQGKKRIRARGNANQNPEDPLL